MVCIRQTVVSQLISQIQSMKPHSRESKAPSRDQGRKGSNVGVQAMSTIAKKINRSLPMALPTKSVLLNSHRSKPRVQPLCIPHSSQQITAHHSRKMSINSTVGLASGRMHDTRREQIKQKEEPKFQLDKKETSRQLDKKQTLFSQFESKARKDKEHNRSNSTISKRSGKEINKNCLKIQINRDDDGKEVNRLHFQYQYAIGKGGFGKVWSVEFKRTKKIFAMKEMLKAKIIAKRSIHSVLNERQLLARMKHPFLVNMAYAFQDRNSLYLVMDLLVGGDLRYHMGVRRKFKQNEAKFFIACILTGLQMMHLTNIIHRDIKPQNLVFDDKGYLRITDLGIARVVKPNNSADTSGTPGYMAPEVMCRQDHSFPVDYYAVGVIAYELMLGKRPYFGRNRKEIRDQIIAKQVQVKIEEVPAGWSLEAADFINRAIQRKPLSRIGSDNGVLEIKEHAWFKGFPWAMLQKKAVPSPYIPKNILATKDYREQISSSSQDQDQQANQLFARGNAAEVDALFQDYKYYSKEEKKNKSKEKIKQSTNAATTSNTHYSYFQQKDISKGKAKLNNFFKF